MLWTEYLNPLKFLCGSCQYDICRWRLWEVIKLPRWNLCEWNTCGATRRVQSLKQVGAVITVCLMSLWSQTFSLQNCFSAECSPYICFPDSFLLLSWMSEY